MPFRPPYIASIELIARFDRFEDVRKAQFVFEDELKDVFRAKTQQVVRPEHAAPDLPWFGVTDGPKYLAVSETQAQIVLNFQDNRGVKGVIATIEKHAKALDRAVSAGVSTQRSFSGIVTTINYPTDESEQTVVQYIAEKYIKADRIGTVVSSQVTIGYQEGDNTYVVYSLQPYRKVEIPQAPSGFQFIDLEGVPAREVGLQVKADVNSRPLRANPSADRSILPLVGETRQALSAWFTGALGPDLETVEVQ